MLIRVIRGKQSACIICLCLEGGLMGSSKPPTSGNQDAWKQASSSHPALDNPGREIDETGISLLIIGSGSCMCEKFSRLETRDG